MFHNSDACNSATAKFMAGVITAAAWAALVSPAQAAPSMSHVPSPAVDTDTADTDDECELCSDCGEPLADGEGYNGECGDCADANSPIECSCCQTVGPRHEIDTCERCDYPMCSDCSHRVGDEYHCADCAPDTDDE